jgi:hypothetical protein
MTKRIKKFFIRIVDFIAHYLLQSGTSVSLNAVQQITLSLSYQQMYQNGARSLEFKDVGFRQYSQHEEDGILLYLFALIGTTNKKCVEICAGNGIECNTANLIVNHRFIGLLVDGRIKNINKAKEFYSRHPDTQHWPPVTVCEWVTINKINEIISQNGFEGQVDLLSLDIDGIDYYLWKEITCISPRVVVLEFNHLWGPDISVTVPYADDFQAEFTEYGSDYAGASLRAFVKLGKQKGYRLVGTNAIATNAFFIRDDISHTWLPEIDPSICFGHPRAQFGNKHRLPGVKNKAWIEV